MPCQIDRNKEDLSPGFSVIHSNRMENLRKTAVAWVRRHPLGPLENEIFIVQSNGMAQWLKLALAEDDGCGISASVDFQLPARFLWQAYRAVLGTRVIPLASPYDKERLKWRFLRLLPTLTAGDDFSPLVRFLSDDHDLRKRYQLARRLGDLYDQYQVYRADWLEDWTLGLDRLRNINGKPDLLPPEQRWQAELWRRIQSDVPVSERGTSRSTLHRRFLKAARALSKRPAALPRRIIIFGISALPKQSLEALHALSPYSQVLFFVHNPCRHYWADIVEDRALLRIEQARHAGKAATPEDMHPESHYQHANPLLASWGKQGRDYIGLLYGYDQPEAYRKSFDEIDLFDDFIAETGEGSLLQQVQQAILELQPLPGPGEKKQEVSPFDRSISFQLAYSRQREVEILQDQLLDLFNGNPDLKPKDVIVMSPDINAYAPHVESVFGNLSRQDPRFVPFAMADRPDGDGLPMLQAVEKLLQLPGLRMAQSDLLDLLQVPAFRDRFGLAEDDVLQLQQWIDGSGIRWGLNAQQRTEFDLPPGMEQNTWAFGLKRMLLGYAVGTGEPWRDIEPYDEIGGLKAALIGPLHIIVEHFEKHWRALKKPGSPEEWHGRILALVRDFFLPTLSGDQLIQRHLENVLEEWRNACNDAGLEEPLTLPVVRDVLLGALKDVNMSQRFLAGMVNFCTLMPMRAIPFKVVCLLGMNDGEYPRSVTPMDFDLMAAPGRYRPGDRSHREDDRYLFLEALLSAREKLHISYIARDVHDKSERMPSVLISQLRDYLAAGWRISSSDAEETDRQLLDQLTCPHPLQPFSKAYFLPHRPRDLFTHAHEWRKMLDPQKTNPDRNQLAPAPIDHPPDLAQLIRFMKNPVKYFFNERLNIYFDAADLNSRNREPFALDNLAPFNLGKSLLDAGLAVNVWESIEAVHLEAERLRRTGELPPGGFGRLSTRKLIEPVLRMLKRHHRLADLYPHPVPPFEIDFPIRIQGCACDVLEGWLDGLRVSKSETSPPEKSVDYTRWEFYPKEILDAKGRISRPDSLVGLWIKHLAGCARGMALTSILAAPDGLAEFPPLDREKAVKWLTHIISFWWVGLRKPLPVTAKTALAYMKTLAFSEGEGAFQKAWDAARRTYEGDGYHFAGELGYGDGVYLKRCYPDFDALRQAENNSFEILAGQLYGPLMETIRND